MERCLVTETSKEQYPAHVLSANGLHIIRIILYRDDFIILLKRYIYIYILYRVRNARFRCKLNPVPGAETNVLFVCHAPRIGSSLKNVSAYYTGWLTDFHLFRKNRRVPRSRRLNSIARSLSLYGPIDISRDERSRKKRSPRTLTTSWYTVV